MGQEAKEKGRSLNRMIVAIDGPAGVGKSTVAKLLAARLGYLYLDTGALYRAVAWNVLHHGVDPEESQAVESLLPAMSVQMEFKNGSVKVLVNGDAEQINWPVEPTTSALPVKRAWQLLRWQRWS